MALATHRPSSEPEDNKNSTNPSETPQEAAGESKDDHLSSPLSDISSLAGGLPARPVVSPVNVKHSDYLDGDEDLTAAVTMKTRHNNVEESLNLQGYKQTSNLTANDLLTNDYDTTYAHLADKVVSVKEWLQDILTERELTSEVAEARSQRGAKYVAIKETIDQLLTRYFAQEATARRQDVPVITAMVTNEMLGLGPIEPLWLDPRISEIMVNGPFEIYVEIKGKLVRVPGARFRDQAHLIEVSQQMLAPLGRTIDIANPYEDGRLPDGSRINITHPAIGPKGPYITIRRFPDSVFSLRKLVDLGSMTEQMAIEIGNLIAKGCSTIVVGGTGSGKTSMLNALSGCIPAGERIITIEDNLELQLHPKRHVLALEARKSHQGEKGNVTIRDLVKNALRQRPDRIIVGEVRDGSAYDMLQAMNTGHDGSMTTVHANDAHGGVDRLVNLMAEVGDIDTPRALSLIAGGIDVLIIIDRYEDGSRRVSGIAEVPTRVTVEGGVTSLEPVMLYEFKQTGTVVDEEGEEKVIGEYVKVNEISDALTRKHRLDKKHTLTLEEIYDLSEQVKEVES